MTFERMRGLRWQGFSLVEVMVTLLIVSIGITATVAFQRELVRRAVAAEQVMYAWQVLSEFHERLRAGDHPLNRSGQQQVARPPYLFEVSWSAVAGNGSFEVQVQWQSQTQKKQKITAKSHEIRDKQ